MSRYKPKGWRGDSLGHSMAARGVRKYSATKLTDPVFLAAKREQEIPTAHVRRMVMDNLTFEEAVQMHPNADKEDLRMRMIQAVDMKNGNRTLSLLNRNGVDLSVSMAKASSTLRESMRATMKNDQSQSLLPSVKVDAINKGLSDI